MYPAVVAPSRFPLVESLNVFAYPMFAEDTIYCPQAGSPLIDAGDPTLSDVDLTRSDIGWHGGPGGFLCPYAEMPPLPPDSLWVNGDGGLIALSWSPRPEADLKEYHLYRGSAPGFWMPGLPVYRVIDPPDTTAADTLLSSGESAYYVVTAADTAGLESDPSVERGYVISGIFDDPSVGDVPRSPQLLRVYPNPFNASTQIELSIPAGAAVPVEVMIEVYDAIGRRVSTRRSLIRQTGRSTIPWEATSEVGQQLASGVYFLRLAVGEVELSPAVKLVVVK